MSSKIEKIDINYKGKKVNGRKLTVSSELNIDIDNAWNEVQKSSLLEFICKGKIKFKPVNSNLPKHWKTDMEVQVKLLVYGFIPFGGIHTLKLVDIMPEKYTVLSNEKNSIVKVWNHRIEMVKLNENLIKYTDEIELYAGFLTSFVVKWAESFYKYRQRRWNIVAEKIKTKAQQSV
ncbi:hypothetical protein [Aquimarina sp. MMG016]|uniref:hypothetical protein n=1 Tax=Aquimarina sp. MMG016 TaxID=2822690 RepID=UPI001B3A30EB|nr:hypothetical protein [Aquimarina sp. MMG016]MBQ4821875.1 hypothetical protein [Aquimarina sp. MMG016]